MITILTPTYNRAHTLERLYKSLLLQNISFEWLIIDDGSTDETKNLITTFQENTPFSIYYSYQENSGKHAAINTGVLQAQGEWIFIVDSDDFLTPDALEQVEQKIYPLTSSIHGIAFRRMYSDGILIGNKLLDDAPIQITPTEASSLFQGDLAYIFRINVLRENPFPILHGEKFVPELYIWNKISDNGKIIYYPDRAIYVTEYLEDGYSKNFKSNLRRNPKGFALFYRNQFFREKSFIRKVKCAIRYLQCQYYGIFR